MGNVFTPPKDAESIVSFSEAGRAVIEGLPVQQALRELERQLDEELEAKLQQAIETQLGAPLVDPEILRGRLGHIDTAEGDEKGARTYVLDGVPILWVGVISRVISMEEDELTATRDIRLLVAERNMRATPARSEPRRVGKRLHPHQRCPTIPQLLSTGTMAARPLLGGPRAGATLSSNEPSNVRALSFSGPALRTSAA
jgi:hypothetical protein